MTIAIRNTVRNAAEFIRWAARAEAGQPVTYHIGNLGRDRAESPALHVLAETVLILSEAGFVATSQIVMRLPLGSAVWYSAARTGRGRAPRAIMSGSCDAHEYRALEAVKARDGFRSISRAIRDHMGCPETVAQQYVGVLTARGWVEPVEPRGYRLSAEGQRMLA